MTRALVVFDEISAVTVMQAGKRVAVVDVHVTGVAFEASIGAVTREGVDTVQALSSVLARHWLLDETTL